MTAGLSIGFSVLAAGGFSALTAGTLALSGAVGGAVSGGVGAALNGAGWQGVLQGIAIGGALGGIGGFAGGGGFGAASGWVLGGMLAGGVANAAINDSWADLAGGIAGGITGSVVGMGAVKAKFGTLTGPENAAGGNVQDAVEGTLNQVGEGKMSTSDVILSANKSKGDVNGFIAKVEAYAKLSGKEVDHMVESGAFKFMARGSSRNYGLMAQGVAEFAGGAVLQVASLGLLGGSAGTSAGVSAAGISYSFGLMAKGAIDVYQGFTGGESLGSMLHTAVYGVKQESGILYPYLKAVTGDVPFLP